MFKMLFVDFLSMLVWADSDSGSLLMNGFSEGRSEAAFRFIYIFGEFIWNLSCMDKP